MDESAVVTAAGTLTRNEFVSRYGDRWFLVRRERALTRTMPMTPQSIAKLAEETLPPDRPRAANRRVWVLTFGDRPLRIGRDADCDVPIDDRTVSRVHATLAHVGDGFQLTDLGGRNGTQLAGKPIEPEKAARLAPGTPIRFGTIELLFADAATAWQLLR